MLKKIITILLIFTAIEFNLQWNGYEHEPNEVKVTNNNQELEVYDEWHKEGNVYYWNVYDGGEVVSFLNFWTSYD
jgi:hypothetical protein